MNSGAANVTAFMLEHLSVPSNYADYKVGFLFTLLRYIGEVRCARNDSGLQGEAAEHNFMLLPLWIVELNLGSLWYLIYTPSGISSTRLNAR